jgi:SRSO17 transposase
MSRRPTAAHVAGWANEVEAFGERIGRHFARFEPRRRAVGYVRGLLSDAERKNGWQLAKYLGDPTPDGVHLLLAQADRNADAVRDDPTRYVAEHLGDPGGVLIAGETGFPKKGPSPSGRPAGTPGQLGASRTVRSGCSSNTGRRRAGPCGNDVGGAGPGGRGEVGDRRVR